ncbi:hypothetical protein ACFL0T_04095 [Candidatus Omnitrophota bacterium]
MADEFSPEERLLRLIKGKQGKAPLPDKKDDAPQAQRPKEAAPVIKASEKIVEKKENHSLIGSGEDKIQQDLKKSEDLGPPKKIETPAIKPPVKRTSKKTASSPNTLLIIAVIGIIAILAASIFIYNKSSNQEKDELQRLERMIFSVSDGIALEDNTAKVDTPKPAIDKPDQQGQAQRRDSFEDYQKVLNEKSIFAPASTGASKSSVSSGPGLRERIKGLRLVGIIPGDVPQAIIEDKASGQTMFLRKGEFVEEIEIRDISNGKIMLGSGDDTISLSM